MVLMTVAECTPIILTSILSACGGGQGGLGYTSPRGIWMAEQARGLELVGNRWGPFSSLLAS